MRCWLTVIVAQLASLILLHATGQAADISSSLYKTRNKQGACSVSVRGRIQPGDAEAFRQAAVGCLKDGHSVGIVRLNSLGGDFLEALKIGEQVQALSATTEAPFIRKLYEKRPDMKAWKCDGQYCACGSACFFIWVSGARRLGDAVIIHRPFVEPDVYRKMPVQEARALYDQIEDATRLFLKKLRLPEALVEKLFATSSSSGALLSWEELEQLRWASYYEELLISHCGMTEAQNNAAATKALEEAKPGSSSRARLGAALRVHFPFWTCRLQLLEETHDQAREPFLRTYENGLP